MQTAISTIKKMLDGVQKDWDSDRSFVQYAMNTKVAAIHKTTPFAVLFGAVRIRLQISPRPPNVVSVVRALIEGPVQTDWHEVY